MLDLGGAPLLRLGRHRRQLAVGRIGDERRPPIVPVALDDPELVVVAGAGIVRVRLGDPVQHGEDEAVAELRVAVVLGDLRGELLQLGDLGVGEARLAFPLLRALQRRDGVVRPDALEIGMAVRCSLAAATIQASFRSLTRASARERQTSARCKSALRTRSLSPVRRSTRRPVARHGAWATSYASAVL